MSAQTNAVRLGVRRGWTEFSQSIRSTQDQGFYLFTGLIAVGYLFLRRDTPVEGTDLMLPSVALPSILAALVTFGVVIGPAYALAMEKEDGTLLRHKAVPHGLAGYFTGQLLFQSASVVPQLLVVLIPSFLLFDNLIDLPIVLPPAVPASTTVVQPLGGQTSSAGTTSSLPPTYTCACRSMSPGTTSLPPASMTIRAASGEMDPGADTEATRLHAKATSRRPRRSWLGSRTSPPRMSTS